MMDVITEGQMLYAALEYERMERGKIWAALEYDRKRLEALCWRDPIQDRERELAKKHGSRRTNPFENYAGGTMQ